MKLVVRIMIGFSWLTVEWRDGIDCRYVGHGFRNNRELAGGQVMQVKHLGTGSNENGCESVMSKFLLFKVGHFC
jgi:hypothetical protein